MGSERPGYAAGAVFRGLPRRLRQPYLGYLEVLLSAELEERERNVVQRRIRDAHLPRLKTLEDFDVSQSPKVPATQIHELAQVVIGIGPNR